MNTHQAIPQAPTSPLQRAYDLGFDEARRFIEAGCDPDEVAEKAISGIERQKASVPRLDSPADDLALATWGACLGLGALDACSDRPRRDIEADSKRSETPRRRP